MRFKFKNIIPYFFQGLIILAPIFITGWAVLSLFNWIDRILPNLVQMLFPSFIKLDQYGYPQRIPGLGFLMVIVVVLLVGYISSSFVVGKLVDLFDHLLEKTPGIRIIYTTVKDFFEAFAGNKRKFDRAVLVSIISDDVYQVGFITHEALSEFGLHEHVAVYIPQSYAFAGHLYFVKKDRVKILTDIGAADAMKFAISGGVAEIDDDHATLSAPRKTKTE
ncbi:DUF502 domain-containing protein [Pollutibacter soli]|uniref:DUF502 domain-containing protein n=1 Tax=Pollutibacter soli TaxID=3034157 RepID=UPI003013F840